MNELLRDENVDWHILNHNDYHYDDAQNEIAARIKECIPAFLTDKGKGDYLVLKSIGLTSGSKAVRRIALNF